MTTEAGRREEVLSSAARVMMREGLDRTSMRRIAREGGFSTGVLTHHFLDKRELIAAFFDWTMDGFLETAAARLRPAASAQEHMELFVRLAVPVDPHRHGEWRLWFELCTLALRDEAAAATLVRADERWEALIADAVRHWQAAGLLRAELAVEQVTILLVRLIDGLCLRCLINGGWEEGRGRLVHELRVLGLPDDIAAHLEAAVARPEGRRRSGAR
jgi:AcrR family transcriptional regulator